jgi:hypothetical protein
MGERVSHVVVPREVRINLPNGEWISVKQKLNAGETKALYAGARRENADPNAPAEKQLDPVKGLDAMIGAYLVDWSFIDPQGLPIIIRGMPAELIIDAANQLDFDDYNDILEAIQAHDTKIRQEKKRQTSAPGSSPTSPSLGSTDGGTNG